MKLRSYIIFVLTILLSVSCRAYSCFAQVTDTTKASGQALQQQEVTDPQARYVPGALLDLFPDSMQFIDTGMKNVHQYDPLLHPGNHYAGLGTNYSVAVPLFLLLPQQSGFDFGFHQWDLYRFTQGKMPFYNTRTPYTDLSYTTGSVELRQVKAVFSQNILPNWNASLQFRKLANDGYYEYQRNSINNFGMNTWYRSASRRYMVAASGIWNSFEAEENGGILSDTLLESDFINPAQKTSFAVKLRRNALQRAEQRFQDQNYNLKQFFYLGRSETKKLNDTTEYNLLYPSFFISHNFNYYQKRYRYSDTLQNENFFRNFYLDSLYSKEFYRSRLISNTISIGNIASSIQPLSPDTGVTDTLAPQSAAGTRTDLGYMAFAKHDFIYARLPYFDTSFQNITAGAEVLFPGRFGFGVRGEFIPYGYNQGDYFLRASAEAPLPLPKEIIDKIRAEAIVQQYEPAFTEQRIFSNHFIWQNDFDKTQAYTLAASLTAPFQAGLKAQYSVVNKLVYFDTAALPRQADEVLQYISFTFDKDLTFWKFHLNNSLIYQKTLQGGFVRFPDLSYRGSYYFESNFFKKALRFQLGVDFRYTTSYAAYAYMPGISRFHLQDDVNIGNYPFIDAFLNIKIKRFQGFVRFDHVNHGLNGFRYYTTPHYPLYPRLIRLGVRWLFYT